MMREGREHSDRDGMGNDRLHGVRVSGKSAQQDQHDTGRPGFLHDIAVFSRIVPVSDTHRQAVGMSVSEKERHPETKRG
jgi:hypothetical protein